MRTIPVLINPEDKILIVAPHPDDESIGVGGLIATYSTQCEIMVMTDGRYGNDSYEQDEMRIVRRKEFEDAMNVVGVSSYSFFDIEDGTLIFRSDVFDKIDYERYAHIFLPNPNDNHSDHTACFKYVVERIRLINNIDVQVYQYEVHKPMADVNCHLDITDVISAKRKMVECHHSQLDMHSYSEQIGALAEYRGFQNEKCDRLLETYNRVDIGEKKGTSVGVEIELAKYKWFTRCFTEWMTINRNFDGIIKYFSENKYNDIAIYGFGVMGKVLYLELQNTTCKVDYIIDKNTNISIKDVDVTVYHVIENLGNVDIVVVTIAGGYEEISKEIKKKCGLTCVSLDEILSDFGKDLL